MTLEGIQLGITVVGSLIAAVAAVWNLYLSMRKNKDMIIVRYGTTRAAIEEGEYLHTLNQSDHKVQLSDFGFVVKYDNKYLFKSVTIEYDLGNIDPNSVRTKGTMEIQPHEVYEVGHEGDKNTVACYARTVSMRRPKLGWAHNISFSDKIRITAKLFWNKNPYVWYE